jgi:dolichyl-phosphate-mannose-protein mannosyltransferase
VKSRSEALGQEERPSRPSSEVNPEQPPAEARPARRWRAALPWPVLAAAGGAGLVAAAVARLVFPALSINNDEAVYLLQADALAHGSLFPRAPEPLSAFTPWFTVAHEGHYLPKYTPFFPALLALSKVLTGGTAAALVLVAASIPIVAYLLAREVAAERRTAVAAALLVAGSPLVVVHTGLHLTYLPTMVLLEAFAWMLLRGLRTRARGWLAGAGLALSAAATIRPYDAVLFGLPLLAWALLRRPFGERGERARELVWIVAGGALPAALLVAYNLRATGNPFRLPFSLTEPLDTLGFGLRKLFPTDSLHHFGPREGATAVAGHLRQLGAWSAGGALTMALAATALWRRRTQGPLLALAGAWVTFPLGYLFFWGPWAYRRSGPAPSTSAPSTSHRSCRHWPFWPA